MTNHQGKAEFYRAANLEAARIIAADPHRYPGVMQEWAAVVLNPPAERTAPATRRAREAERSVEKREIKHPDTRPGLPLFGALRELRAGSKEPGRRIRTHKKAQH